MWTENYTSEPPGGSYEFHEGHWGADEFDQAIDLTLGEEFLYGKSDLAGVTSAGLHVGSATTHLTISKLALRTGGRSLSSKSVVKTKEVFYESPVLFTPYRSDGSLDSEQLKEFLDASYSAARLIPDLIDTGVVTLSGKARENDNRAKLMRLFGPQKDRFLFVSEGPGLQGILAALGAGAVEKSAREGKKILNIDLGASGARFVWVAKGFLKEVWWLRGGARALEYDQEGKLAHLDEAGQIIAGELGLDLRLSKPVTRSERTGFGRALADTILDYLEEESLPALGAKLAVTAAPSSPAAELVQFSGGVAEYVYGFQKQSFGDVGQEWGEAIRKRAPRLGVKMAVHTPPARIRAVPIGAAYYAIQLPHEKVYGSHGHFHGVRNLMVIAPQFPAGLREAGRARSEVEQILSRFDLLNGFQAFALSLDFLEEEGSYPAAAEGIFAALGDRMDHDSPLVLVGESDAPLSVARIIASRAVPEGSLIALPGLHLHDLDFVDVGEAEHGSDLVVLVRSLVFR